MKESASIHVHVWIPECGRLLLIIFYEHSFNTIVDITYLLQGQDQEFVYEGAWKIENLLTLKWYILTLFKTMF